MHFVQILPVTLYNLTPGRSFLSIEILSMYTTYNTAGGKPEQVYAIRHSLRICTIYVLVRLTFPSVVVPRRLFSFFLLPNVSVSLSPTAGVTQTQFQDGCLEVMRRIKIYTYTPINIDINDNKRKNLVIFFDMQWLSNTRQTQPMVYS